MPRINRPLCPVLIGIAVVSAFFGPRLLDYDYDPPVKFGRVFENRQRGAVLALARRVGGRFTHAEDH